MAQIRDEGWTHNQLRMYWGKQILRWTNTPEHAFRTIRPFTDKALKRKGDLEGWLESRRESHQGTT